MAGFVREDDQAFYVEGTDGAVRPILKTPGFDVPGGAYDMLKKQVPAAAAVPSTPSINPFESVSVPTIQQPQAEELPPMKKPEPVLDLAPPQPSAMPAPVVTSSQMPLSIPLTSSSSSTSMPINDPEALARMQGASARASDAAVKQGEIREQIAGEQAKISENEGKAAAESSKIREAGAKKREQQFNDYTIKSDALYKDYESTKIVPKGYFEEDNLGQNLQAAVAIMMGAIGGALSGTNQNMAVQVMDRAIDRDLAAQRDNLGKKREVINVLGIKYQAAKQAGFDDEEAKLLAKADAYKATSQYAMAQAKRLEGTAAKFQAEQFGAELDAKAAQMELEATKGSNTVTNQVQEKPLDLKKIGNGREVPPEAQKEFRGTASIIQQLEDLKAFRKAVNEGGAVEGRLDKLKATFGIANADEAKLIGKSNEINQKILNKLSGTAASDKQTKTIETFSPLATDGDEQFFSKLDNLLETMRQDYNIGKEAYGEAPTNFNWPSVADPEKDKKSVGFKKAP